MSVKTHNFRIGLFVLVGALLFIGALFAMGLKAYFGQRDLFETCVTGKVENLSVGALVMLRGVTIGKVSSIDFIGSGIPGIQATICSHSVRSPKGHGLERGNGPYPADARPRGCAGLRARVQGQGFLGASILALEYVDPKLYPAEPIPWTPKHYYIPSAPSQFSHVMASLEKSLSHAEDLDLAGLLDRAKTLIDAANRLATNVNHVDFQQLGTNAEFPDCRIPRDHARPATNLRRCAKRHQRG